MTEEKILLNTSIELIDSNEEFSSISLNPNIQWAKIVVTDDLPNGNKKRIPQEEFDNLIRTGINMPIKMAEGEIKDHPEAMGKPIGVLTNFLKEANKLIALAALWKKEREKDVYDLKDMFLKGLPPQVSWEISYMNSELQENYEDLKDTSLNGLAVVANPAYKGRTAFVAMSSQEEDKTVEELEELRTKYADLEKELETAKTSLSDKEKELEAKETELAGLREFKATAEAEKDKKEKLGKIKTKFEEAGIEKEETYFTENAENLLALTDEAVDFVVQELVAFKKANEDTSSEKKTKIPNIQNTDVLDLSDPKRLGQALRELKSKK